MPHHLQRAASSRRPWISHGVTFWIPPGAPFFVPLLTASVLVGFRESMSLPYITLFAIEKAHMNPLQLGVFLTVRAGGAIAISMMIGAWFDRRPSLLPMLLALASGSLGFALMTTTTDLTLLCLIAALPLGLGAAAFPLLFALAKVQAAGTDPVAEARCITVLRASFSLAWGIGPAIGAVVVGNDRYHALFWVSALCSGLAFVPLVARRSNPSRRVGPAVVPPRMGVAVALAASSLVLFSMAISMGAVALPIAMTVDFSGSKADVGLASSVCALLEVLVMAIAVWPGLLMGYRGMAIGFVATILYFAVGALAGTVWALIGAQAVRAVSIGLVSCVGISYLQELMPNRVGAASVLFANTSQIGQLLAGLSAGAWAAAYSYHSLFWLCAVASLAGFGCLTAGHRR